MTLRKNTLKVDRAVDELHQKGITYLYEGRHNNTSKHITLLSIFTDRMTSEHPTTKYTYEYAKWDGVWCYKIKTHNL